MAQLSKPELFDIIVQSIYESGWNVIYISDRHPFRLKIYNGEESYLLKIIIYNLSHGGGYKRPHNEYRIQLKVPAIELEAGYKTLILGYWSDVGVFAGFDATKHLGTPGWSSSLQIKEENLRNAHINGFSPCDKGNGEIAIAFTPAFFVEYVKNLEELHSIGESSEEFEILENVSDGTLELNNTVIQQISPTRQTAVVSISKKKRDSSFKERVLRAYGYACAFCSVQLKLIDASHILPVSVEDSTDETCNGIALCSLHHRAYDISLVTLNNNYQIIHNEKRFKKLTEIGHDGGADSFLRKLRPIINVPPSVNDRPLIEYINRSNEYRGWDL